MTWINEVEKPSRELVYSINWAKSGKGLVINTGKYSAFLWANDQLSKKLLEALTIWSTDRLNKPLEVIPDKASKNGFTLSLKTNQFPVDWYWYPTTIGFTYGKPEMEGNPFLD